MFISKMLLPRRTFLRGAGAAVALPLLEAMVPAMTALAQTAAAPQRRFGAIYIPHGAIMDQWTPATVGSGFDFKPILKPLEAFKDRTVIVSNLARPGGESTNTHIATAAGWLSGAIAKPTEGEDVYLGMTADQIVARKVGHIVGASFRQPPHPLHCSRLPIKESSLKANARTGSNGSSSR